ncbi:unnamed protein product [Caenorhabditis bovis]|uniref:PRORP domain-containing protein n=1 Tax=Caenorhabditis bovis TaxID=2654633 RepID=A0A8S1F4T4_9PELO|nr:unnamed protein product [Caenorhabditis bovis]
MSPKVAALTKKNIPLKFNETRSILSEVLRCNAFHDNIVFENCMRLLAESESSSRQNDAEILAKIRFSAVAYRALKNEADKRAILEKLARNVDVDKCKIDLIRNEAKLFRDSLSPSDTIPDCSNCLSKNYVVLCYFLRELEQRNFKNIRELVENYDVVELENYTTEILEIAKAEKVKKAKLLQMFLNHFYKRNPFYISEELFETTLKKVLQFTQTKFEKFGAECPLLKQYPEEFLSNDEIDLLKETVDEHVFYGNQGQLTTKEFKNALKMVADKKRQFKNVQGENLIVVDSLNFGKGHDVKNFSMLEKDFKHVIMSTRRPPRAIANDIHKRFNRNVIYCDKTSADDIISIRCAWEFGPKAKLLTNDHFRDHRTILQKNNDPVKRDKLIEIWDRWYIDSIYKHDGRNVEPRRRWNVRIRRQPNGTWLLPVVSTSPEIRKFSWIHIQ